VVPAVVSDSEWILSLFLTVSESMKNDMHNEKVKYTISLAVVAKLFRMIQSLRRNDGRPYSVFGSSFKHY
jgi:hypothetical protein